MTTTRPVYPQTPKLPVVDKAESLAEEVYRHFTDTCDDLDDDPDMLDDAIDRTQSLIDRLHEIKRY
ncbi:hypothetical protein DL546_004250 [Coniochaeta pulveracea]|uniref:Uncharacterized protein n=1 Tax=Coniochaeta pulveracea TaxID=177199 RepID=A0A420Y2T6_9PEZI|nr:hypothetical protein DL546_004250 [Coniochaeta pulveracea]